MKPSYSQLSKLLFLILLLSTGRQLAAQDSTKKDMLVNVGFYTIDNRVAYLAVHAKTKIDGRFQPVKGARLRLYLDKDSAAYLTGTVITDPRSEEHTSELQS